MPSHFLKIEDFASIFWKSSKSRLFGESRWNFNKNWWNPKLWSKIMKITKLDKNYENPWKLSKSMKIRKIDKNYENPWKSQKMTKYDQNYENLDKMRSKIH